MVGADNTLRTGRSRAPLQTIARSEDIVGVRLVPFGRKGGRSRRKARRACVASAAAGFPGKGGPDPRRRSGIVPIDRGTDRNLLMARIRNRVGEPLFRGQSASSAAVRRTPRVRPNAVRPMDTAEIKGLPRYLSAAGETGRRPGAGLAHRSELGP
jgi:hypothetical protein